MCGQTSGSSKLVRCLRTTINGDQNNYGGQAQSGLEKFVKIFINRVCGRFENGAAIGNHNSVSVSRHEEAADDRGAAGEPRPKHMGPKERG